MIAKQLMISIIIGSLGALPEDKYPDLMEILAVLHANSNPFLTRAEKDTVRNCSGGIFNKAVDFLDKTNPIPTGALIVEDDFVPILWREMEPNEDGRLPIVVLLYPEGGLAQGAVVYNAIFSEQPCKDISPTMIVWERHESH